jgi:hypothetical protein
VVEVPGAVWTLPAAHAPTGRQTDWLEPEVNVPIGHAAQVRSLLSDGVLVTRLPAVHVVHMLHAAELSLVLKVPVAHPAQVRSLLAVPAVTT